MSKKTHFLDFSSTKDNTIKLKLNDEDIKQVKATKYLGLMFQDNLKWDIHIQSVIKKLNSQIPLYLALKNLLSTNKLSIVYKSLSMSTINYGIELYAKHNNKWMNQLQKTQNRLLKILLKKPKLYRTNTLHKEVKLLKVNDIARVRHALISHRFIYQNDTINWTYRNMSLNYDNHNRNLRNRQNIQVTTNAYKKQNKIVEKASIVWNDLIQPIKTMKNRNKFKEIIETTILNSYV